MILTCKKDGKLFLDGNETSFFLHEYIPETLWDKYGTSGIRFIDERLVASDQFLRDYFKVKITINNWHVGGGRKESGFRFTDTKTGALYSDHKYGRASDKLFDGLLISYVYNTIMANEKIFFDAGIKVLEDVSVTKVWLHSSVRATGLNDKILIVKP